MKKPPDPSRDALTQVIAMCMFNREKPFVRWRELSEPERTKWLERARTSFGRVVTHDWADLPVILKPSFKQPEPKP